MIRDGLATASTGRVGRAPVEIVRIKITEAGRAALTARSGSTPGMTGTPRLTGNFPSVPRIDQITNTTNGKAEDKFGLEDGRRKIVSEIMRLSPPPQGCAQRARLVLEYKFTRKSIHPPPTNGDYHDQTKHRLRAWSLGRWIMLQQVDPNAPGRGP